MRTTLLCLFTLFSQLIYSQAGTLDSGFAENGIFYSDVDSTADEAKAILIMDDGKILTSGYIGRNILEEPEAENFYLRRFNSDGTPDMSFGNAGVVTVDLAGGTDSSWDMEVQADGKILAAGFGWQSWERALIMRFNEDGSLDNTFSGDGMAVIEIGGFSDRLWNIKIQDDGKIVGCGICFVSGSSNDWCATRLHPNGNLDGTFGTGGVISFDLSNAQIAANDLEILDDGRILLTGYGNPSGSYIMQFAMLQSNGQLDTSWDEDGLVEVAIGTFDDAITNMVIQPDGKIVGAGYTHNGSNYDFALIRLNPDGSLDESFGNMGIVQTPIGSWNEFIESITLRPDGKIVVGGYAVMNDNFDFAVAMYNPDGTLVENFGNNGIVTTDLSSNDDLLFEIAIDGNGDLIAAGSTEGDVPGDEIYNLCLVKYLGDLSIGVLDAKNGFDMMIYPNPIAEKARLRFELQEGAKYAIELYDNAGRFVMELSPDMEYKSGLNEVEIQFPSYIESGNYVIKLRSDSGSTGIHIIKD